MRRAVTPLYVATNQHVVAVHPDTGEDLWRTKLPKCGSGAPIALLIKEDRLFAGGYGQVWCLRRGNGELLWHNGLPGLGYSPVLLTMEGAQIGDLSAIVAEAHAAAQRAAHAASAGT